MPQFPVSPLKEKELLQRMERLGIRTKDIREEFIRASGAGGQRVNKAATCVRVTHLPSGISVKYGGTRSQGLNRFLARRMLLDALDQSITGRADQEQIRREKIRRQKKRRARRAKNKEKTGRSTKGPKGG